MECIVPKKTNISSPNTMYYFLTLILATLPIFASTDSCHGDTGKENSDLTKLPQSAPLAQHCDNLHIVSGDIRSASVFIFGEHHDDRVEVMLCMFALMQTIQTKTLSVLFEESDMISKEEILKEVAEFRKSGHYVSKENLLYEAICQKANVCGTWDDAEAKEDAFVDIESSIRALIIEITLLPRLENLKFAQNEFQETLLFLTHIQKEPMRLGSYLDEVLEKSHVALIQNIIDQYRQQKKDIKGIVQKILNDLRDRVPQCRSIVVGEIANCLRAASTETKNC